MRWAKKYRAITDIIGTVYCEQKVVSDREHGDARSLEVRAEVAAGTLEHLRFQVEGQTRAAIDQHYFITIAIYGPDTAEINFLHAWCDRVLIPAMIGRLFTRAYYVVSPGLVPLLCRSRCTVTTVRVGLNVLSRLLGIPR